MTGLLLSIAALLGIVLTMLANKPTNDWPSEKMVQEEVARVVKELETRKKKALKARKRTNSS